MLWLKLCAVVAVCELCWEWWASVLGSSAADVMPVNGSGRLSCLLLPESRYVQYPVRTLEVLFNGHGVGHAICVRASSPSKKLS